MPGPHPLKLAFAHERPGELAAYLAAQGSEAIMQALADLPAGAAAGLVAHLPRVQALRVLAAQDDGIIAGWLDHASLDDALALALNIEESRRVTVFARMERRRTGDSLRRLLAYPQTTVGALADPAGWRLEATLLLDEALLLLRKDGYQPDRAVWVVDADGKYLGLLDPGRALLARHGNQPLGELALRIRPLLADTTLVNARDVTDWQRHPELPVVDHLDHLLGSLSREHLVATLAGESPAQGRLIEDMGEVVRQYFHVMGNALGALLGTQGPQR